MLRVLYLCTHKTNLYCTFVVWRWVCSLGGDQAICVCETLTKSVPFSITLQYTKSHPLMRPWQCYCTQMFI